MSIYGYDSKYLRLKKWSIAILVLALLAVVVVGSSCTSNQEPTSALVTTEVNSLDVRIRTFDYSALCIWLIPKDDIGLLVKAEGSLSAKLWLQPYFDVVEKNKLVQEWSDIRVTEKDYAEFLGARIGLEYDAFMPAGREENQRGILEVTFMMSGGKSLTS